MKGDTPKLLPITVTKKPTATMANSQEASFSQPGGTSNIMGKFSEMSKIKGLRAKQAATIADRAVLKVLFAPSLSPCSNSIARKRLTVEYCAVARIAMDITSEFTNGTMP